jgi:pullulanase-type alpha-1,6-glucosidase
MEAFMSVRDVRRKLLHLLVLFTLFAQLFVAALPPAPAFAAPTPLTEAAPLAPVASQQRGTPEDEALVRPPVENAIQDEVFYFVLPDRFENGDTANDVGDDAGGNTEADILRHGFKPDDKGYYHGGDLAGLLDKMDYIEGLGVTAIWMAPIFENRPVQGNGTIAGSSSGYHGYWVTDFMQVDPHFGTNAELQALVDEAHSRGIRVFFDIIVNHTADVITYAEGEFTYRNKTDFPYRDANGNEFDDRDYAGTDTFPPMDLDNVPEPSFPYTPVYANDADATAKNPAWLNDRTMYHNRGDTTFSGESSTYGDFFGLDDLFTERPEVVQGMIDIHKFWISEVGIDGFRLDTAKHVNMEFWQKFAPEIMAHAAAEGNPDFFIFGEVFDGNPAYMSEYTTEGQLPATLDFGFQGNVTNFAVNSGATDNLRNFFAGDDYYTDADSNAYHLPVFTGNHDVGRLGRLMQSPDPVTMPDSERVARSQLAHALMYFARGVPIIYYGDEQGFTGEGGDKDARQDMMPSQVASYNDDDLIGTDATTAQANFDTNHPLYQAYSDYADVYQAHLALRRGAHIQRYSTNSAGIYAFSRIHRDEKVEYVVAFNNAETEQSATFPTYVASTSFTAVYPAANPAVMTDGSGQITLTVPPLSFAIYRANAPIAASQAAPTITFNTLTEGQEVLPEDDAFGDRRQEVGVELGSDVFAEVTFAVRVGDAAEWTILGTDNNAPYRVFHDVTDYAPGTALTYKAIVNDLNGHLNSTMVQVVVGEPDQPPGECVPHNGYAIIHYYREDGNYDDWGLHLWGDAIDPAEATEWGSPKPFLGRDDYGAFAWIKLADGSQPLNFIVHRGDEKDPPDSPDRSFVPNETPQIWLKSGDVNVYTSEAEAQGFVTIHYRREDNTYDGWGLHLWGDGLAEGQATEWAAPKMPDGFDEYGAYYNVAISDAAQAINFIMHKGDEKDPPDSPDRSFVPNDMSDIWLMSGDVAVYESRGAALNVAVIHYHRPAGDYGDYSSSNYNDFWGLHVWTGAAQPNPSWQEPLKPVYTDTYGVTFEVPLADDATQLNYILHRGDEKDQEQDQVLDLATYGREVWILQGVPGYLLPMVTEPCGPSCVPHNGYAIIHYYREDGNYDGWGLHLWGDGLAEGEATEWATPKPFLGRDDYGAFAWVKLEDGSLPINFIVHRGDEKDPPDSPDRSFVPNETPEIWLKSGDVNVYTSEAEAQGFVTIHYRREDNTYDGWGLHLWGDGLAEGQATEWAAPKMPDGFDEYGAYYNVAISDAAQAVNFIMHKGDEKDPPDSPDRSFVPNDMSDIWLMSGDVEVYESRGAALNVAVIHYHRPAGDYGDYSSNNYNDYWGLHVWNGAAQGTEWTAPLKPVYTDTFGVTFEVPLAEGATTLNYILHRGDEKDLPDDQALEISRWGHEVWVLQGTPGYLLPLPGCEVVAGGDLTKEKAHWLTERIIAWNAEGGDANEYALHYAPNGGLTLGIGGVEGDGSVRIPLEFVGPMSGELRDEWPHLSEYFMLRIPDSVPLDTIREALRGQLAVSASSQGVVVDATGVQIPGVLDDLYTYQGELGIVWNEAAQRGTGPSPTLRLWAPTAKSVTLHLFEDSDPTTVGTPVTMTLDVETGVWSVTGNPTWKNQYYLYEVVVYSPATMAVETNLVTDPYSVSLSMNSRRSQIVDLDDPALEPEGWDTLAKPPLTDPEDITVYEIHMRDFSVNDPSVPAELKGKYLAFTLMDSYGMQHLRALAEAGLSHLHLLPTFDIASINENPAEREEPNWEELASYEPNSPMQQEIINQYRANDAFNWGYDPFHYNVPEGSYATNPDGTARIVEYRQMVESLNESGLRVVVDVVYNHTAEAGQGEKSVLDRVVPGYYHRLDLEGNVAMSTCCQNTATEHNMMEKLMVDSVVLWATEYKVDAFRFDLMGHHMKSNMLAVRDALHALTPEEDGVDGSDIYIYGEGWNFGEVENNQRGENATQLNMGGTGIGTFSDRLRDAARGGGPFDNGLALHANQGFINGLYYDPNIVASSTYTPGQQLNSLLHASDLIRLGLAGNLEAYTFESMTGQVLMGSEVDYNGQPAGYTEDPQEHIVYVDKHDNQTLYDINAYKAPTDTTTIEERVRIQNLGMSIVGLSQGVPFFHAGMDMLRSKSLDRNSYDSGDWFNKLDFTYQDNNWGVGLPPAQDNQENWPLMSPLLADPNLDPDHDDIMQSVHHFREILAIREDTALFRLETAQQISESLRFHNTGPDQLPGLIVMSISDDGDVDYDANHEMVVTLFNANDEPQTFTESGLAGRMLALHPIQANSADPVVRTSTYDNATGTFTVPARTTAVFVDAEDPTALTTQDFGAGSGAGGLGFPLTLVGLTLVAGLLLAWRRRQTI